MRFSIISKFIVLISFLMLISCGGDDGGDGGTEVIIQRSEVSVLTFADEALATCVQDYITNNDIQIVKDIKSLSCQNSQIVNVDGIEALVGLEELRFSGNSISDIIPISTLSNLKILDLSNNKIEVVLPLLSLKKLESLNLSGNISIVCNERSAISESLGSLVTLDSECQTGSSVSEVVFEDENLASCVQANAASDDISNIEQITSLQCRGKNISMLDGIEQLKNLRDLDLTDNAISDMSVLASLTRLNKLILSKNQVDDISDLSSLIYLQELWLDNNQISNISGIDQISKLQILHLSNNQIRDYSGIGSHQQLRELRLSNNKIIDLYDLGEMPRLIGIWLDGNQIIDISPLNKFQELQQLWLSDNWLIDIDQIINLQNLKWLHLDNTEVKNIESFNQLKNIKWLQLANTKITDVTALYNLRTIDWLLLQGNNSIPCAQLDQLESNLGASKVGRPDQCSVVAEEAGEVISAVVFADKNLRNCVYDTASINSWKYVSQVSSLDCSGLGVTNISGIEKFANLADIDLSGNTISNTDLSEYDISCEKFRLLDEATDTKLIPPPECSGDSGNTVGGVVSGLNEGSSFTVVMNAMTYLEEPIGEPEYLNITANGDFVFNKSLSNGDNYNVEITAQPASEEELCSLSYGSGTILDRSISNIEIICSGINHAPVANAGTDFKVSFGDALALNGSAVDQDDDPLAYRWTYVKGASVPEAEFDNSAYPNANVYLSNVPTKQSVELTFRLTVTDPEGLSSSDDVVVTVVGLGSEENPFQVLGLDGLKKIGSGEDGWSLDGYYKLSADIDASSTATENPIVGSPGEYYGFLPIGSSDTPFVGGFDGGGYKVSNLYINRRNQAFVGLFGYAKDSSFKNIELENLDISGAANSGALVGMLKVEGTDIEVSGNTISGVLNGTTQCGGLIGKIDSQDIGYKLTLNNNSSSAYVNGSYQLGGLYGVITGGSVVISDSSFSGGLGAGTGSVGGIAGTINSNSFVADNLSSDGNIILSDQFTEGVGGVFGQVFLYQPSSIASISKVSSSSIMTLDGTDNNIMRAGGLLGFVSNGVVSITDSVNAGRFNMTAFSGDSIGGIAGGISGQSILISNTKNLSAINLSASGSYFNTVGGITGFLSSSSIDISDVSSEADIDISAQYSGTYIGGLVGSGGGSGTIIRSHSLGDISYVDNTGLPVGAVMGGIIGQSNGLDISQSFSTAKISGEQTIGGLAGSFIGNISDCYSNSSLIGNSSVAGLVADLSFRQADDENPALYSSIKNSFAIPRFSARIPQEEAMGFAGLVATNQSDSNLITSSFWNSEISGTSISAGGNELNSQQLRTMSTFTEAGWDFENTWMMLDDGFTYPRFSRNTVYVDTWQALSEIRDNLSANVVLTKDLTESDSDYNDYASATANGGLGWLPIGSNENRFIGTFDGNGYVISGLNINRPDDAGVGLFGYSGSAYFADIELINSSVNGSANVGLLVGMGLSDQDFVVSNSSFSGVIESLSNGGGAVGILVSKEAIIFNNIFDITLAGNSQMGGILGNGILGRLTVNDCNVDVSINHTDDSYTNVVGGLVGTVSTNSDVSGVFVNNTEVLIDFSTSGAQSLGGFFGLTQTYPLEISNSHVTGKILVTYEDSATNAIGGFIGNGSGEYYVIDSYSEVTMEFNNVSGGGIGGIFGQATGTFGISNSFALGDILAESASYSHVGGIVGLASGSGNIDNSYFSGSISVGNSSWVGGVFGLGTGINISRSYVNADINAGNANIGTFGGYLTDSTITNSYAIGSVSGRIDVGGFIGITSESSITDCYAASVVTADEELGGFVANTGTNTTITSSFWDYDVAGTDAGFGQALSTSAMQDPTTYQEYEWDIINIWKVELGSYPTLQ